MNCFTPHYKKCGCRAVFGKSDLFRMKKPSGIIAEALRLYASVGISLRAIGRMFSVAHTTVARWVKKLAGKSFPKIQPASSQQPCVA